MRRMGKMRAMRRILATLVMLTTASLVRLTTVSAQPIGPVPQVTQPGSGGGAPWCQFNDYFWSCGGSVYGKAVWWCDFYTWMNESSYVAFVAPGDPPRGEIATLQGAYWNDALSNTTSTALLPTSDEYYIVQAGWAQGGGGFSVRDFAPGPVITGA